jgi:hypothetical protein
VIFTKNIVIYAELKIIITLIFTKIANFSRKLVKISQNSGQLKTCFIRRKSLTYILMLRMCCVTYVNCEVQLKITFMYVIAIANDRVFTNIF